MYNTILTSVGFGGVAIGCVLGGVLVKKTGLRNLLLISQVLAIVANVFKMFLWYPSIVTGRILFGTAAGITNFCYGKALNETVPSDFT